MENEGITKGRKTKSTDLREVPYMAVSNVKEGYIDWTNVKTILATEEEINQYRLLPDDVLMTEGGDPDKVGRGSIIMNPPEDCIHQNHIFRVRLDESRVLPRYFSAYLQSPKAKAYLLRAAKQTTGIASINMKQLRGFHITVELNIIDYFMDKCNLPLVKRLIVDKHRKCLHRRIMVQLGKSFNSYRTISK